MTNDKIYVVRSGEAIKFATLMDGKYLGNDRWACDPSNLNKRNRLEVGLGTLEKSFLSDVTHWAEI